MRAIPRLILALTAVGTAAPPGAGGAARAGDGLLALDDLLHDSRDLVYRSPRGAVPAGTPVRLRFRTLGGDATSVTVFTWNETTGERRLQPMRVVATATEAGKGYDFWQATLPAEAKPALVSYRFVVRDGPAALFYEDDAPGEGHEPDGGRGAAYDRSPGRPWLINSYAPSFRTPDWLKGAVLYQIFPDRFADGDPADDPTPSWPRVYGKPVVQKGWDERPEGACRYYTDYCCNEDPWGRDFYGGDLQGIRQKLPDLADLGVEALYLNPIFDAPSNHKYDTRDYDRIDPAFGDLPLFERLAAEASSRGIRLILDGVFNHVSSDSPYFDRYGHYPEVGAYESKASPYFDWFTFDPWPDGYQRFFGVATLPQLSEAPAVQQFLFGKDGIAQRWLERGAAGWRLDAMDQKSHAFWRAFREAVKAARPDAALVGEFWHQAAPWLDGREMDAVMNYRFRSALIGFVRGDTLDANGRIAGLPPSGFDAVLRSIEEEYPPESLPALMNLVDSHDTERILWTLTPGRDRPDEKEDPARLARGIRRLKLAALLQLTLPGAPTIYYGDEVGLTGDTDPDDRRPFPWGHENGELKEHYRRLIALRRELSCLRRGSWTTLLADDASGAYAFLRQDGSCSALVAVNRSEAAVVVEVGLRGRLAAGTRMRDRLGAGLLEVEGGALRLPLPPGGGVVLTAPVGAPMLPPEPEHPRSWRGVAAGSVSALPAVGSAAASGAALPAPAGLSVTSVSPASVSLAWEAVAGVSGYELLRGEADAEREPLALVGPELTRYLDTFVLAGRTYRYTVRALDAEGRASPEPPSVAAVPEAGEVRVTLVVTAPDTGGGTVHVAGGFQGWVASTTPMTPEGPGRWTYTLAEREGERLEYKYTLGSWERIEKGAGLEELPNRSVVVAPGPDGTQRVEDRVLRWRSTDPCARR